MKIILNPKTTQEVMLLHEHFPGHTATHVVNLAIRAYYNNICSANKNTNDTPPQELETRS